MFVFCFVSLVWFMVSVFVRLLKVGSMSVCG